MLAHISSHCKTTRWAQEKVSQVLLYPINQPPLRVNTKLPSTPQGFFFHIEHKHKYFLFFIFFFQTYIWHGKKCELSVDANLLCLERACVWRQYPEIGSSSTLAYVWSEINSHSEKWTLKIRGVLSYTTKHSLKKYSSKLFSSVLFLRLIWDSLGYISTNHIQKIFKYVKHVGCPWKSLSL